MRRAVVALLLSGALFSGSLAAETLKLNPVERALPTFELPGLDKSTWNREALAGKPYIVNFWATWCAPCVHELPAMNRAAEQLLDAGVGMLAVNISENAPAIEAFMKEVPIEFPVAVGDQLTFPNWKVRGLPTTYIVSPDGQIIAEAIDL